MSAVARDRGSRGWYVRVSSDGARREYKVAPPGADGEARARAVVEALNRQADRVGLWSPGYSGPMPASKMVRGWLEILNAGWKLHSSAAITEKIPSIAAIWR